MNALIDAKKPRKRRQQQRSIDTQARLLETAIELFSSIGFDGVTVAMVEEQAEAQRGLLAYHFKTKEDLWRTAADDLFGRLQDRIQGVAKALEAVSKDERRIAIVTEFIRFSAEHPALQRLIVQESKLDSWRMNYIVDKHVRPHLAVMGTLYGGAVSPHGYYMMIGAAAFVFSAQHECKALFGIDPCTDDFARAHARAVVEFLGLKSETASQ